MKTIKDAVIELGGKLPDKHSTKRHNKNGWYISANKTLAHINECVWFNPKEFESEAKRLGYINGYRWGVEYATNGKRPDLGSIIIKPFFAGAWRKEQPANSLDWRFDSEECDPVTKFIITDQRYKPADTSYLNKCEYKGVADIDQMKVECMRLIDDKPVGDGGLEIIEKYLSKPDDSLSGRAVMANEMSKLGRKAAAELAAGGEMPFAGTLTVQPAPQDNSWHKRGELPPVGVECEIRHVGNWIKCKPIGFDGDGLVCKLCIPEGGSVRIVFMPCYGAKFRPIRTEREKVIEAAIKVNAHTSKQDPRDMMVAVIHKLYDAGMLVLPQKKSDTED